MNETFTSRIKAELDEITAAGLSKKERIKACKENFSLTWELHKSDKKELVNYYDKVLKTKYL